MKKEKKQTVYVYATAANGLPDSPYSCPEYGGIDFCLPRNDPEVSRSYGNAATSSEIG